MDVIKADASKPVPDVGRRRAFALGGGLASGLLAAGLALPAAADSYDGGNTGGQGASSRRMAR